MSTGKAIIEIRDLSKLFNDQAVLNHINLDIQAGEFLTILGPSGCGKTTLLRLLSGFDVPTSGTIRINDRLVNNLSADQRFVNTVFQNYALFPHLTIFENIAFGLRCKKVKELDIKKRVEKVLKIVRLSDLKDRKPQQLSGGQQQRVAIARAVVNEPLVLLLDEPLSALDYSLRKQMQIELKNLQRQLGITFVFVTHDQEEALSMSDRIVVMNHGVVEQVGTPREVYEAPANLHVASFIGEANVFDTEIIAIDGDKMQVKLDGLLMHVKADTGLNVGDRAHTIIRPEDMRVWDKREMEEKDDADMFVAHVQQVIYKGSTVDLILKTEQGKTLLATEFFDEDDENLFFESGEKVWVEWMHGWEAFIKC